MKSSTYQYFSQVFYPLEKTGDPRIRRCRGIAVDDYSFSLGALALNPSGFYNVGVKSLAQTGRVLILRKSMIVFSIPAGSPILFQLAVFERKGKHLPDFEKGSDNHGHSRGVFCGCFNPTDCVWRMAVKPDAAPVVNSSGSQYGLVLFRWVLPMLSEYSRKSCHLPLPSAFNSSQTSKGKVVWTAPPIPQFFGLGSVSAPIAFSLTTSLLCCQAVISSQRSIGKKSEAWVETAKLG